MGRDVIYAGVGRCMHASHLALRSEYISNSIHLTFMSRPQMYLLYLHYLSVCLSLSVLYLHKIARSILSLNLYTQFISRHGMLSNEPPPKSSHIKSNQNQIKNQNRSCPRKVSRRGRKTFAKRTDVKGKTHSKRHARRWLNRLNKPRVRFVVADERRGSEEERRGNAEVAGCRSHNVRQERGEKCWCTVAYVCTCVEGSAPSSRHFANCIPFMDII